MPAGSVAGASADTPSEDDAVDGATAAPGVAAASDDGQSGAGAQASGPEASAEVQSADAKAAEGSAGGTTISIAVYRSSFPIAKWDLNDQDFNLTKAEWAWSGRTGELPKDASPGSEVSWPESGKPADYAEPTRAGFEFAGWSTDKSASAGGYIDGSSPKLAMPEGAPTSDPKEYTLYALWTPLEYSVVFDLAKNPGNGKGPGSDASYALNWESADGVRTVTDLGNGRFRVDGFTMKEADYDKATRTVGLPEPSRTGYRFLGWSEPDGQSLAMDNAAKDGFALNPVRLTQIDGTPVLAARWTSAFGVTAPLSITFGDYDKTGAPGNPWLGDKGSNAADDTTQSEADDTTKSEQEGYEALGQAYFENTGWHEAIKVVGLTSERHASANQVLTTYDSKQASEAAVLGDGTEENPGERLLSLYSSASAPSDDKSSGVHFRLTDALDETALGSSFTMAPQGEKGAKLLISYGLNLSTDPTDGSANHGLVLPTNDYERKQIATVSYTFATAAADDEGPQRIVTWNANGGSWAGGTTTMVTRVDDGAAPIAPSAPSGSYATFLGWSKDDMATAASNLGADTITSSTTYYAVWGITAPFYVHITATKASIGTPGIYGLSEIKAAANSISSAGSSSPYHGMYANLLAAQKNAETGEKSAGPFFKLKVNGRYLDVQLIGIRQDVKTAGGYAGLTFQTADIYANYSKASTVAGGYAFPNYMNLEYNTGNTGGWASSALRSTLNSTFYNYLDATVRSNIARVNKTQQDYNTVTLQSTTNEIIWLPSSYEVYGNARASYNPNETGFQYLGYQGSESQLYNPYAYKRFNGESWHWWCRSSQSSDRYCFCLVNYNAELSRSASSSVAMGVAPAFCL